jgi:predicted dehydrogenase
MKKKMMESRRRFLVQLGVGALSLPALSALYGCSGIKENNQQNGEHDNSRSKLGIALAGLGSYATYQLAPALQETEYCKLAGIITGTSSKIGQWKKKYDIPDKNIYNYDNFDSIKENPDIDIVYVVLPNFLHAEYTIRAAQAGKHVICEKPMAITVDECDSMISACNSAGKMLSIGYRLHFEPHNIEMARLGQNRIYGPIKRMSSGYGFAINNPNQWRLKKSLAGGGPLMDVGIYCVQGFCYTTGLEPLAVTAWEGPKTNFELFSEVEQSLTWQFEMPEGINAKGHTSYAENMNYLKADAEHGTFELNSAFGYSGQQGYTPDGIMQFPQVYEQARHMDAFAMAIKNNEPLSVSGEMGRRDVNLLQAIYRSMETGERIEINH